MMAEISAGDIERFLNSMGMYKSVEKEREEEEKEETRPSILPLVALAVGVLLLARGGRT